MALAASSFSTSSSRRCKEEEEPLSLSFVFRYSIETETFSIKETINSARQHLIHDLSDLYVSKSFRKYGLPDDLAYNLFLSVYDSLKDLTAVADHHPCPPGCTRLIPVPIDIPIPTQQTQHSKLDIFRLKNHSCILRAGKDKSLFLIGHQVEVEQCSICLDNSTGTVIQKEKGFCLPCLHVYHTTCLFKWILKNPTCPLCRSSIGSLTKTQRI